MVRNSGAAGAADGSAILAVDDDPVSRRLLEAALERDGHQVVVEESAERALATLERLGAGAFGCLVTDYRMPGLNGVDLRSWVSMQDPAIAAILVTAEGEQKLVEQSLRAGFADFLNKPLSTAQLRKAVNAALEQTAHRREMACLERNVEQVARTQREMLISELRTGLLAAEVFARPKYQAGGDFLSHIQVSANQEVIMLADVSGHDLAAAYVSAYYQGMVRGMLETGVSAAAVFERFNRFLADEWSPGRRDIPVSISACSLEYDRLRERISLLSCGAPEPVYTSPDGRVHRAGIIPGFPLGWFSPNPVECWSRPWEGGQFLLWTDGLADLAERLVVSPLSLAHALLERGGEPEWLAQASDDIMAVRVRRADDSGNGMFHPVFCGRYRPAQAAAIDQLQQYWSNSIRLAAPDLDESTVYDILLASREALANALAYGCRPEEIATLTGAYSPASGIFRVHVCDPGPGHDFDAAAHHADDELADLHRGLMLISKLARRVATARNGAELTLDFQSASKGS